MGILGALSTAVSGLSAQSYALENISGNIANSQTVGFKRVDTSFVDLIPDSPVKRAAAGSVMAYSALTNTLQGTLRTTNLPTNMALSGDGYFVVAKNEGSETQPIFNSINQYTRRGDYKLDANGYLVNGANRYLVGTTYNPATGAVTGSSTTPIQIPDTSIPAKQSTEILYSGNLPTLLPSFDESLDVDGSSTRVIPEGKLVREGFSFAAGARNPVKRHGQGTLQGTADTVPGNPEQIHDRFPSFPVEHALRDAVVDELRERATEHRAAPRSVEELAEVAVAEHEPIVAVEQREHALDALDRAAQHRPAA